MEDKTIEAAWNVPGANVERPIAGINTIFRVLPGIEVAKILADVGASGKLNPETYTRTIIDRCVVSPKPDVAKLTTLVLSEFVKTIEDICGISELARKNLPLR